MQQLGRQVGRSKTPQVWPRPAPSPATRKRPIPRSTACWYRQSCVIVSNVANDVRPELKPITHLFVYGTLRPGDVRWHFLEPFVVDEGWDDTTRGKVYDTGLDYPAAIFDAATGSRPASSGTIYGRTYALLDAARTRCLEVLDEVEGVVEGGYRRIAITTGSGIRSWAYEYGAGLQLTHIESGDWFQR